MKRFVFLLVLLGLSLTLKTMLSRFKNDEQNSEINLAKAPIALNKAPERVSSLENIKEKSQKVLNTTQNISAENANMFDKKEFNEFANNKLKEIFPGLIFEQLYGCPKEYKESYEEFSDSKICSTEMKKLLGTISISLDYVTTERYEWSYKKYHILEIHLGQEEGSKSLIIAYFNEIEIMWIVLENNLVTEYRLANKEIKPNSNYTRKWRDIDESQWTELDHTLEVSRKKVAEFLLALCMKSRHKKTCDAHNALIQIKIPEL